MEGVFSGMLANLHYWKQGLTHKQLEMDGRILSTVDTDGLVLSVSTVLIKYSLFRTSFIQKYRSCKDKY